MAERIDNLQTDPDSLPEQDSPFFSGPAEFLVNEIARQIRAVPQWVKIFGEFIDPYKRMDYQFRNLPALRIYNDQATKEFESWFIDGDIKADTLLPAALRRNELQQVQDSLAMALLQQFRRPQFFETMAAKVPGLNMLGSRFSVDKSLGFEWEETECPLTQITINFRLDLRIWDDYLTRTNRTKDSPYEAILGNLERIASTIKGLKEGQTDAEVTLGIDQGVKT